MAMLEETKNKFKGMFDKIEFDKLYTWDDIKFDGAPSWSIIKKYVNYNVVDVRIDTKEYSVEEIINELNDCAGEDCYGARWHYAIIDGKIYNTITESRIMFPSKDNKDFIKNILDR